MSRSTLPPVTMTPTRRPRNVSGFFRIAARGTRRAWLDHDLHPRPDQAHCLDDLMLRHGQHIGHVVRHEVPGEFLERHLEAVGHSVGRVVGDDAAGAETAGGVVGLLGLGGVDLDVGGRGRKREAGARDHAAATDRRDHGVEPIHLPEQLARAGRLPRDHPRIVVGVDEVGPGRRLHLGERRLARGGRSLALGDLPAIGRDGVLLGLRRRARHDHMAGNAPSPGGVAERQRVVAAGMGGDAPPRLRIRQAEDGV